ncbi:unnamed protein product [Enterobius vermicularis]|uniref:C-type lectin domain-containing protein n=1 Tax=Enterobius vermicularis TaxID=51028 RepID=A0A0N4VM71_ENTVE|nr:unnamed protein product [Enterobius vermicularis]
MILITDGEDSTNVGVEHNLAWENDIDVYALGVTNDPPEPVPVSTTCGCDKIGQMIYNNYWLDMIFVVDTSDGVARQDFASTKVLAKLEERTTKEMQSIISNFKQTGGQGVDVQKGLELAQDMITKEQEAKRRLNVRKVVVLITTESIDCRRQQTKFLKNKATDTETHVICQLVSIMETNCYCLDDYTQLTKNTDNCAKYAECYRVNSFSLPQNMAQTTCGEVGGTLPNIVGSEKEEFINELHKTAGFFPFWIDGTCTSADTCRYSDNSLVKYKNWCTAKKQPNFGNGNCVYEDQCVGFNVGWFTGSCDDFMTDRFFTCQVPACSVNHYCDYNTMGKKINKKPKLHLKRH